MTKPKTYGEYADQTPDAHVDSRVRDREITDEAWVMLNMEDELSPEIVQKLKVTKGRRTYVDYYDEYHSSKMKEGGLCEAVMDHILYELSMIHEDMISDVSPNRKEIER